MAFLYVHRQRLQMKSGTMVRLLLEKANPSLCLHDFIAVYMKLTVETFAQNQKSHPMHMEIVAASWTFAYCCQKSEYDQHGNPDAKYCPHGSVGG